jgi:hypothetical protein
MSNDIDDEDQSNFNKILRTNRPLITNSSINVYLSGIRSIAKDIKTPLNTLDDIVDNHSLILKALMNYKPSIRKTKIAGFISLLDRKDKNPKEIEDIIKDYRIQMIKDAEEVNNNEMKQKFSKKQEDNYISWNEVEEVYKKMSVECLPILKALKSLNDGKIFDKLQKFILLSMYVLTPPRRSMDYADFKIHNIDVDNDNFMTTIQRKHYLVFNSYKNKNKLGTQQISITPELAYIIKKWTKINDSDYLISTKTKGKVSQVRINQLLNDIFNKKIGSSMLRHIYLTHHFSNVDLEKLKDTTEAMGSSQIERTLKYVNKNEEKETINNGTEDG